MALFLSTFINKIDKKGRVSVPVTFRAELTKYHSNGFIAFRSLKHEAIECCDYSRMQKISESVDNLDLFSQEQDDFTAAIFADSIQISIDSDGRIVLPKKLLDFIKNEDEIAFVGKGATFQLWNPLLFNNLQKSARQRMSDEQATLKLANVKNDE